MGQIAGDAVRYAQSYLNIVTPNWAVAALCFGILIPVLQKVIRVSLSVKTILISYIVLIFSSLFMLNMLGIGLKGFAPETFESWRLDLNAGADSAIPSMMVKFIASLPLAFAATSFSSGLLDGRRNLLSGLFGVGLAVGLAIVVVVGIIYVGCAGWSSCP